MDFLCWEGFPPRSAGVLLARISGGVSAGVPRPRRAACFICHVPFLPILTAGRTQINRYKERGRNREQLAAYSRTINKPQELGACRVSPEATDRSTGQQVEHLGVTWGLVGCGADSGGVGRPESLRFQPVPRGADAAGLWRGLCSASSEPHCISLGCDIWSK